MTSESLQKAEDLAAAGATAPRVSLSDIEAAIDMVDYQRWGPLTLAFVKMKNGFVVVGKSAPASPENFNEDKGKEFAYEDAVRQLWPLMGFALREKLAGA